MKSGRFFFHRLVLGVATVAVLASPVRAAGIVTLGAPGWREQAPALSVTSGGTLMLSVLVPGSLEPSGLAIDLWQISGGVALPLGKRFSFADAMVAESPDVHGVATLRLTFPEVKRKTQVLVKFIATQEPQVEAGQTQVWVYPSIDWAPMARRFKIEQPRLLVFGESPELRVFLKAHDIAFSDNGADMAEKLPAGTLAMGVLTAKMWRESKQHLMPEGGRVVVFVSDAAGLPGAYTMAIGTGAITQVTLPVIESLAHDPRAEDLFFQIIEQQLHSASAALP